MEVSKIFGQFGNGLIFRAWEDRKLGINNSIFGFNAKFDYKKFNINRFSDDYMKEFWNLVQGEENTLHRQGKNTL